MRFEVRRAHGNDWPSIERLLSDNDLPLNGAREHLDGFLVAVFGGEVIGCAGLELYGSAGLLRSVAVGARHRNVGVAARLTAAATARAEASKVQTLYLLTTTAADYFTRRGFVAVLREQAPPALHQSEEFRGACPATATLQVLQLDTRA